MSGTEKRQRKYRLTARFNDAERATVMRLAQDHGVSPAALFRDKLLNVAPPARSTRRPHADMQAVARLLGELQRLNGEVNKVGSNLNQLTKYANMGKVLEGSLSAIIEELIPLFERDLSEVRLACLQALGKEPRRPDTED
jgi:hypothetical protein